MVSYLYEKKECIQTRVSFLCV